jgi:hypothetical protein
MPERYIPAATAPQVLPSKILCRESHVVALYYYFLNIACTRVTDPQKSCCLPRNHNQDKRCQKKIRTKQSSRPLSRETMDYQHQRGGVPGGHNKNNNNNNNHDEMGGGVELNQLKMNDPALMSVQEKRARLAKFGQQNRDHFENSYGKLLNKAKQPPQQHQVVRQQQQRVPANSRDGNDDGNVNNLLSPPDRPRPPATTTSVNKPQPRTVWRSESWRGSSERLPSKQRDSPENPPAVVRRASQDFIPQRQYSSAAASSRPGPVLLAVTDLGPVPTTPPATTTTSFAPRQPPFMDKDLVATSSNEDERHFRIVHAQSLLVPPKPQMHRRRSLPDHLYWETEFDSDDFSDPFYSSSSANTNASSLGSSDYHHPHATAVAAAAAARHRRRHSMDSIEDGWYYNNAADKSGNWSLDVGMTNGMYNNINAASSTNAGRYTVPADARHFHRHRGNGGRGGAPGVDHARRYTNHHQHHHHQQQQHCYHREEVASFDQVNNVNNDKSSGGGGIRHKIPLLLCKSNKTGDDDNVRSSPTVMIPTFTKRGHVLVHPKHVMAPRLQRGHPNMSMPTASTTRSTGGAEFDTDCSSTHGNRRNSPKPPSHLQVHLPVSDGVGYFHSIESETGKGNIIPRVNSDATPIGAMHNATILQDRMLTSSTLDLLCGNGAVSRVDDPLKYYSGRGNGDGVCGEEGTESTWDDLSSSCGPSTTSSLAIVPGAVASKLGDVFAEEAAIAAATSLATVTPTSIRNNKRSGIVRGGQDMLTTTTANKELHRVQSFPMRASAYEKKVYGVEVSHVASSTFNEQESNGGSSFAKARALQQHQPKPASQASTTTCTTTGSSSAASTIASSSPPFRSNGSYISRSYSSTGSSNNNKSNNIHNTTAAQKFGAPAKKSTVQASKEKLQKKWAEDRAPTHVKKTNWYVDKKSGTYRKKVAINFSKPEDFL